MNSEYFWIFTFACPIRIIDFSWNKDETSDIEKLFQSSISGSKLFTSSPWSDLYDHDSFLSLFLPLKVWL